MRSRNVLGHKMVISMCFSVYFFQTYYSKLGFNWEKAAYLNINYSEQPTLDSKSWQLLIEEIMSHFLWNLWADWLICFVCLLRQMKGEKIKTDNESALLKNQWLLLFHFIVGGGGGPEKQPTANYWWAWKYERPASLPTWVTALWWVLSSRASP